MVIITPDGIAGPTLQITSDNTSNALIADGSVPATADLGGQTAANLIGAIITVQANELRVVFSATAVASGLGHVITNVTDGLVVNGTKNVKNLRYVSETTNEAAVFMVTPFYGTESLK